MIDEAQHELLIVFCVNSQISPNTPPETHNPLSHLSKSTIPPTPANTVVIVTTTMGTICMNHIQIVLSPNTKSIDMRRQATGEIYAVKEIYEPEGLEYEGDEACEHKGLIYEHEAYEHEVHKPEGFEYVGDEVYEHGMLMYNDRHEPKDENKDKYGQIPREILCQLDLSQTPPSHPPPPPPSPTYNNLPTTSDTMSNNLEDYPNTSPPPIYTYLKTLHCDCNNGMLNAIAFMQSLQEYTKACLYEQKEWEVDKWAEICKNHWIKYPKHNYPCSWSTQVNENGCPDVIKQSCPLYPTLKQCCYKNYHAKHYPTHSHSHGHGHLKPEPEQRQPNKNHNTAHYTLLPPTTLGNKHHNNTPACTPHSTSHFHPPPWLNKNPYQNHHNKLHHSTHTPAGTTLAKYTSPSTQTALPHLPYTSHIHHPGLSYPTCYKYGSDHVCSTWSNHMMGITKDQHMISCGLATSPTRNFPIHIADPEPQSISMAPCSQTFISQKHHALPFTFFISK